MKAWMNWGEVPDLLSKEQFYQICHISKKTAQNLIDSGVIPCQHTGKKTHCYQIRKEDVQKYLNKKGYHPEIFTASTEWSKPDLDMSCPLLKILSPRELLRMQSYYETLLKNQPDIMTTADICKLTGYNRITVNKWCQNKFFPHLILNKTYRVPKQDLIAFFCSPDFFAIRRKTAWHLCTLQDFHMIIANIHHHKNGRY